MGIEVKLEAFEGPLDLLLHLIEKNKIDIYDIPIAEITDQYLLYVEQMKETDLDTMSDFVVVGAQLVNIKSRMLLPVQETEEEVLIDPRTELVERLIEYKKYKYSAGILKDKTIETSMMLFKGPTIPAEVSEFEIKPDISEIIGDLTLAKLKSVFDFVIQKQVEKKDTVRGGFGEIKKESISLTDCIHKLRELSKTEKKVNLKSYLMEQPNKIHVIVNFLAILEMMKMGLLSVVEEENEEIAILFSSDRELTEEEYKSLSLGE